MILNLIIENMGSITESYPGAEVYIFIEMTSAYKKTFVKEREQ